MEYPAILNSLGIKDLDDWYRGKISGLEHELEQAKDTLFAVTAVCNGSSADTMLQESEKERFRAALEEKLENIDPSQSWKN